MSKARELAELGAVYDSGALSNRNFIINGAMQVAQRGTSSTGVGATNNAYPTCDRWEIETANSAGRATMTQESDGPDGFANSLKLACTTADTSVAADEVFRLQQVIEAQNLQSLAKGTSSAKQFTLSFYVKGNAAATYNIEIYDLDNTRHICASFNVTTSWNRISLTFAGDTTGAINDDNGGGFQVGIYLHEGSNYTSGTLATSWASVSNANRSDSNNTSFFDSTSRTFFITGVQLEVGTEATPFEHQSYGQELQLCKRYYQRQFPINGTGVVHSSGTIAARMKCPLPVQMRASPSLTIVGTCIAYDGSGSANLSSFNAIWPTPDIAEWDGDLSGSLTTGRAVTFYNDQSSGTGNRTNNGIELDAEL